jgi:hypothetical protein
MYVLVAVIENVGLWGDNLTISSFNAEEIDTNRLRPREEDGNWTPVSIHFSPGSISTSETIIIPLEIELRDNSEIRLVDQDHALEGFRAIQNGKRRVFAAEAENGKVFHRKRKEAFRPPEFPYPIKYTYGPRLRLVSAVTETAEVKLRQFDPSQIFLRLGLLEGTCPSIYVRPVDGSPPMYYGRILVGAHDRTLMRNETFVHEGAADSIELVESEPEITTIRMLQIYITDSAGIEHIVHQDTNRYVLPGAPLRIQAPEMRRALKIRIEVDGFYQSMQSLLVP